MILLALTTVAIGLSLVALCSWLLDMRAAYIQRIVFVKRVPDLGRREYGYDPYNSTLAFLPWCHVMELLYEELRGEADDLDTTLEIPTVYPALARQSWDWFEPLPWERLPNEPIPSYAPIPWLRDFEAWFTKEDI